MLRLVVHLGYKDSRDSFLEPPKLIRKRKANLE